MMMTLMKKVGECKSDSLSQDKGRCPSLHIAMKQQSAQVSSPHFKKLNFGRKPRWGKRKLKMFF